MRPMIMPMKSARRSSSPYLEKMGRPESLTTKKCCHTSQDINQKAHCGATGTVALRRHCLALSVLLLSVHQSNQTLRRQLQPGSAGLTASGQGPCGTL